MTVNDKVSPLHKNEKIEDAKFVDPKKKSLKDRIKSYINEHPKQVKIAAVAGAGLLTACATIGYALSVNKKEEAKNQILDSTDFEVIEVDTDENVDDEEIIELEEFLQEEGEE